MSGRLSLLGIGYDQITKQQAATLAAEFVATGQYHAICFVNPEGIVRAKADEIYRESLEKADLVLPDGVGLLWASRILGQPIKENVNGTDFFPYLCRALQDSKTRVFFLGGKPGVAERVSSWVNAQYPGLTVCGVHHGYFSKEDNHAVISSIKKSHADVLFVGMGSPGQELWLAEFGRLTGVKVSLGVGGLFDYYSGRVKRAPFVLRALGLEWFWRLMLEPSRIRRQIALFRFVFLVVKAKLFV